MSVKIIRDDCDLINKDPPITFPYELDTFQKNAINGIEEGENVLVTAHTSAGKSTVAEYAIALAMSKGQKVIYTSPIKTLSNQKYYDFKQRYDSVGILTGDIKENPEADCLVMTTEILRNMLFMGNVMIQEIAYVIFDEIHYINDKDRGHVWEETITMLPNNIGIIMLSATISNSEYFAQWIASIKKKDTRLVGTDYRPVPLTHYIYWDNDIYEIMDTKGKVNKKMYLDIYQNYKKAISNKKKKNSHSNKLNNMIKFLDTKKLFPCIVFSFSRINCEKYAMSIVNGLLDHEQVSQVKRIFNKYINGIFKSYKHLSQTVELFQLLQKGIGFHHSGLVPPLKEIQEILFSEGLIKVLFATETFAVGVNMPTRTVVFTELEKFDGETGRRLLNTSEYLQMAGRAGRRGKDKVGTVIYFPVSTKSELPIEMIHFNTIGTGKSTQIQSKLKLNPMFLLKLIKSETFNVNKFIGNSLLNIDENEYKKKVKEDRDNISRKILKSEQNILSLETKYGYKNSNMLYEEYEKLNKEILYARANVQKKLKKKINTLLAKPENKEIINVHEKHIKLIKERQSIDDILSSNELYFELDLSRQLLQNIGYISKESNSLVDLDRTHLTKKGLIASEINECNELLLTEMLCNGILNNLTTEEIISVLAIFIEPSQKNFDDKNMNAIPRNLEEILYCIDDIGIENILDPICDLENEYLNKKINISIRHFYYRSNWDFVQEAYLWANQHDLGYIYQTTKTDIYEGNFVRNIIKILNICNEITKISEYLDDKTVMEKLQNVESLLLRGIVSFESIYI